MSRCRGNRPPFGTMRLPADAFEEQDPIPDPEGGPPLRRARIKALGPDGPILTEQRAKLIHNEISEIKPLEAPVGSVFFLDYHYGKKEDG